MSGCSNCGTCEFNVARGAPNSTVFNWLEEISAIREINREELGSVEVRFKQDRKGIYANPDRLHLKEGDIVAVQSSSGHDIGVVSLTGKLVLKQIKRKKVNPNNEALKKVYRKAKKTDIEKWKHAISNEKKTLEKAKLIVQDYKLEMKLSNVEYQGDKTRATFYYTAEKRVDFRELLKAFSKEFKVRIEMRQIGARQESAKFGGIGTCGRELCCSSWMTNFPSVTTNAAKHQQISINQQKITGQCGRLKCCLNFELEAYLDEIQKFPPTNLELKTKKDNAKFFKMDIYKQKLWYTYTKTPLSLIELTLEETNKILALNKKKIFPKSLEEFSKKQEKKQIDFKNATGIDSINRFDKTLKKRNKRK